MPINQNHKNMLSSANKPKKQFRETVDPAAHNPLPKQQQGMLQVEEVELESESEDTQNESPNPQTQEENGTDHEGEEEYSSEAHTNPISLKTDRPRNWVVLFKETPMPKPEKINGQTKLELAQKRAAGNSLTPDWSPNHRRVQDPSEKRPPG